MLPTVNEWVTVMRREDQAIEIVSGASDPAAEAPSLLRATMIGDFALTGPDGGSRLPKARKARAIIAYLILAEGRPVSRQKLMTLGWSERGEEQARASLRQALYDARVLSAGDTPLLKVGRDTVRADIERVRTDIDRLSALAGGIDAGALVAALPDRLEPLLADLDGVDPAIDEWLAGERPRYRERLLDAIRDAASRALATGKPGDARRLAGFLADEEPLDEDIVRLTMACQHACGDRAAIRRVFTRLQEALERQLGVAPEKQTVDLYQELMANRASAAPLTVCAPTSTAPPCTLANVLADPIASATRGGLVEHPSPRVLDPGVRSRFPRRWLIATGIVFLLVLALAGGSFWFASPKSTPAPLIAVEPLQVPNGDQAAAVVRLGLSDDLTRAASGPTLAYAIGQVGDPKLDVQSAPLVLSGTATTISGKLHVRMRLRDAVTGGMLWSREFEGLASQPEDLRGQIIMRIGSVLPCAIDTRGRKGTPVAVRASQLYIDACETFPGLDTKIAIGELRQVTALAPQFGRGWAALSFALALSGNDADGATRAAAFEQARASARTALTLDHRAGRAYYALAATLPEIGTWHRRMTIIDKGLAADPDNADLFSMRGMLLDTVGRWHEAGIAYQRAFELDPFDPYTLSDLVGSLALHGRLDEGERLLEVASPTWRHSVALWQARFRIEVRLGNPRRALAMLNDPGRPAIRSAEEVEFWKLSLEARADPTVSKRAAARRAIMSSMSGDETSDTLAVAHWLAVLGDIDDAYRMALSRPPRDERSNELLYRSYMKAFRDDPRFMLLARQRGLLAIWQATDHWPDFCSTPGLPYDCRKAAQSAMKAPLPRQTTI